MILFLCDRDLPILQTDSRPPALTIWLTSTIQEITFPPEKTHTQFNTSVQFVSLNAKPTLQRDSCTHICVLHNDAVHCMLHRNNWRLERFHFYERSLFFSHAGLLWKHLPENSSNSFITASSGKHWHGVCHCCKLWEAERKHIKAQLTAVKTASLSFMQGRLTFFFF